MFTRAGKQSPHSVAYGMVVGRVDAARPKLQTLAQTKHKHVFNANIISLKTPNQPNKSHTHTHTGFLKTRASLAPGSGGNLGLLDVVAALRWTRDNIAAFGGDPTRVTIVGHDTGAALANLVLISKSGKCEFN